MGIQNLLGFFLPVGVDFINNYIKDTRMRFIASVLICAVVGIVLNLDKLHKPADLIANAAVIFAEAQITYKLYWEKSQPRQAIFGAPKTKK